MTQAAAGLAARRRRHQSLRPRAARQADARGAACRTTPSTRPGSPIAIASATKASTAPIASKRRWCAKRGEWKRVTTGKSALETAAKGLKAARRASSATLASARATVEETLSAAAGSRARWARRNIDHRLRQADFRDQAADPAAPGLGGLPSPASISSRRCWSSARTCAAKLPVLAHRVRKAAQARREGRVPESRRASNTCSRSRRISSRRRPEQLARSRGYLLGLPRRRRAAEAPGVADRRRAGQRGAIARLLPRSSAVRNAPSGWARWRCVIPPMPICARVAAGIAAATGATLGMLAEGGNAAGAYLAGALPHRDAGGIKRATRRQECARDARAAAEGLSAVGGVEPWADCAGRRGAEGAAAARASWWPPRRTPTTTLKSVAHVLLPIGTFAETRART